MGTGWDMESIWFATHPLTTTPNDDFVEGAHVDTVVAGAGLTGLTTAVLLARSGQKVAVLEARRVGAVTTGHTTAKVSLLQERGVAHQTRDAWTYAETEPAARQLQGELDACRAAGLDEAAWTAESELPFPIAGALRLPGQAQIHPLEALEALLSEFTAHGGILIEEARVTDASSKSPVTITTTRGRMTAERLILATGTPILDRVVGRSDGTSQALADLIAWTERHFSGAEHTHAWSAQDYRSVDRVPFVGPLPRGGGRIDVATGYNKWGMTNAVAAALNLSSQILEGQTRWADTLGHRRSGLAGAVDTVKANAEVGMEMTKNWVEAELRAVPGEAPAEGAGLVGRGEKGRPEAVSTVDGATCRVSGVCTHLGGVLRWNDAERSWDCPLHGSRFAADGTLLEGPAVSDLPRLS
ncbi:FAD-dependent oxidoreductase [Tessaracoccus defluvii]|nr:FAD-dependent oxidoreductase [Tessaracoccus defluvii]